MRLHRLPLQPKMSDGDRQVFSEVLIKLAKGADIDHLKALDDVVQTTGGHSGHSVQKADTKRAIQKSALSALPESTADLIKKVDKGGTGGRLAIELVRRDLTDLTALARVLYTSTVEERRECGGLRRLHKALWNVTELHGALALAGVDVEAKGWAKFLTTEIPSLRQLRSTPWHQVALRLKLVVPYSDDSGWSVRFKKSSATQQ